MASLENRPPAKPTLSLVEVQHVRSYCSGRQTRLDEPQDDKKH